MDIVCASCKARISIPDHKVPKGKKASFLCPKCGHRIQISPGESISGGSVGLSSSSTTDSYGTAVKKKYDAADKPFDFVDDGRQTVLVCMGKKADVVAGVMTAIGRVVKQVDNVEQALLNMRYHLFDVVVLDEGFDEAHGSDGSGKPGVLDTLCLLGMALRRRMFVVLVTDRSRTMDRMAALEQSVDIVVNRSSLDELEKILVLAIKEHEQFYAVFNESLKKAGKA